MKVNPTKPDFDQIRAGDEFNPSFWNYDNTVFHEYRIEGIFGAGYDLYIDNVSFATNLAWAGAGYDNGITFGDGTSRQNQIAEVSSYNFTQVPVPCTILLFGTGLAGLVGTKIRRKKK